MDIIRGSYKSITSGILRDKKNQCNEVKFGF